jgi:D-alanyl-D-alanine carboxypeptidase-like protein
MVAVLVAIGVTATISTDAAPVTTIDADLPAFSAVVSPLDPATRRLMIGSSWRPGCPVPLRDLRLVRLRYYGFDGRTHRGELVVHRWYADGFVRVFRRLYVERYPIRRMRLVDHYGADDLRSMNADNTSAFNCRLRAGSTSEWSQHAYGRAIDVNPVENPFVTSDHVSPAAGEAYADRSQDLPGMIHLRDPVWWAFHAIGWEWGGAWQSVKDYQHFSANGR